MRAATVKELVKIVAKALVGSSALAANKSKEPRLEHPGSATNVKDPPVALKDQEVVPDQTNEKEDPNIPLVKDRDPVS